MTSFSSSSNEEINNCSGLVYLDTSLSSTPVSQINRFLGSGKVFAFAGNNFYVAVNDGNHDNNHSIQGKPKFYTLSTSNTLTGKHKFEHFPHYKDSPPVNYNLREVIGVFGPSGSGKSTYIAKYAQKFLTLYPNGLVFILTRIDDGDVYQTLIPHPADAKRIAAFIDQRLVGSADPRKLGKPLAGATPSIVPTRIRVLIQAARGQKTITAGTPYRWEYTAQLRVRGKVPALIVTPCAHSGRGVVPRPGRSGPPAEWALQRRGGRLRSRPPVIQPSRAGVSRPRLRPGMPATP